MINKKYFVPLLAAAAIYFGGGCRDVRAENKLPAEPEVGLEQQKEHIGQELTSLEKQIEQALIDSKECDRVYWVSLPTKNVEKKDESTSKEDQQLVINCDELLDNKYVRKIGINLGNICDVSLRENYHWYIFGWLGGDDVLVHTKDGNVYSMRFWDKHAREVFTPLQAYIQAKGMRCEEVPVLEKYKKIDGGKKWQ